MAERNVVVKVNVLPTRFNILSLVFYPLPKRNRDQFPWFRSSEWNLCSTVHITVGDDMLPNLQFNRWLKENHLIVGWINLICLVSHQEWSFCPSGLAETESDIITRHIKDQNFAGRRRLRIWLSNNQVY